METLHLIITGRVQGIGFRNYVAFKARQFQINGWVRNRLDGSVEAMLQGTPENVAAIIKRLRHGPPQAVVADIAITAGQGEYRAFDTLPTE